MKTVIIRDSGNHVLLRIKQVKGGIVSDTLASVGELYITCIMDDNKRITIGTNPNSHV